MSKVIITGANQGIGFYMVKQLLADNNQVAVFDLETDRLSELKNKYDTNLLLYKCDVCRADAVNAAVSSVMQAFNGIDYAIHNACKCTFDSMENTSEEIYKEVFDVNYYGALHMAKAVIPIMKQQHAGKVCFTSSGVGIMGFINISPYASSKGAIESLAKCLNIEYQTTGISFHIFQPPLTRTKSSAPLPVPIEFMADPEKVGTGLAKRMHKKKFIICHSFSQTIQTKAAYLFPISFGKLMSKMAKNKQKENTDK